VSVKKNINILENDTLTSIIWSIWTELEIDVFKQSVIICRFKIFDNLSSPYNNVYINIPTDQ